MALTPALLLFGGVLLALVLADPLVRRLPLSPAVVYLGVGWAAGATLGGPGMAQLQDSAGAVVVVTELVVLVSLLAVGLRLRVPPTWAAWRVALLMAGPGMVVVMVLGMLAAVGVLGLPWAAALLLAAIMAPTDPVLASEIQIKDTQDRDAVRLSITAEGGLNDGTALPGVMLALGLMGLHELGENGLQWAWSDLLWAIGGGALLGVALGRGLGRALHARLAAGDRIARDELLYFGAVTLAYGLARLTGTSAFVVVFAAGVTLLAPVLAGPPVVEHGGQRLAQRLESFGGRIERLVEAATVMAVGVALHAVSVDWRTLVFGLLLVLVVRPLSVYAVVRRSAMVRSQRRLVAWFGIRGIGTLFYLAYALDHGVTGALAEEMVAASLVAIALSIVLHGVSATPLMVAYQRRRSRVEGVAPEAAGAAGAAGAAADLEKRT